MDVCRGCYHSGEMIETLWMDTARSLLYFRIECGCCGWVDFRPVELLAA